MPELPEVARTALSLNNRLKGKALKEIRIHSGRYTRHGNPPGFDQFITELPMKINSVDFHGKLIVFELESTNRKWWIWNTLGMSGGWKSERSKHGHVELITDDLSVFYTDPRNFGTLRFVNDEESTKRKIRSIGPNHLHDEISDELFEERLRRYPELEICQALMIQSIIGGIGNYIKAEVLYRSKISPKRKVKDITSEEFRSLNQETASVVRSSFSNGGATIHSFTGMDWEEGLFPFYFKVYGRRTCEEGHEVVRENTADGRTTHWVPQIQI
jgi:formamidopyrimidine-DNA glycosylase